MSPIQVETTLKYQFLAYFMMQFHHQLSATVKCEQLINDQWHSKINYQTSSLMSPLRHFNFTVFHL